MNNRLPLILFVLVLHLSYYQADAQEKHPDNPGRSIKLSLFDAIDPFSPAYLLSYEQPFARTFSWQAEGGFISTLEGRWVNQEKLSGFKSRIEVRKYWPFTLPKDHFYIGLQGMFKQVRYPGQNEVFCRDDCQYFQQMDFNEVNNVLAGHLSLGLIFFAGRNIAIDIGGFGGFRWNNRLFEGIPDDAELQGVRFFRLPGKNFYPSLGFTLKTGFAW